MIRLEDFSCYYKVKEGYAVAVDHVTLEVPQGQFLVLMGPSGCGKTTLLRGILGLCQYTDGKLLIDGKPDADLRENTVAYVSQEYALYPHLTVYDNIAYPLRSSKMKQGQVDRLVREMASQVGLDKLLTRLPKQLSGGQQQRLAIARALVKSPKIVLYDEPFSNMDPGLREQLRQLVYEIGRKLGQTVIYVTHDAQEADALADRVVWMHEGKITDTKVFTKTNDTVLKKRKPLFFAPQTAEQEYTVSMLPHDRKQVFWDVMKLQKWKLVKLGLVLLAFALPIHLFALLEPLVIAQLQAQGTKTAQQITDMALQLRSLRALVNIPLLMLFSVGYSGVSHVIRQLAWGEPVTFGYDLKKGIRQNWAQMLLLSAVVGFVHWLCVYCANLSAVADAPLAAYGAYLPTVAAVFLGIPVGAYMTVCIPVYANTLRQNLRLGLVLFLKAPARTLGTLAGIGLPLISFVIPNFYCNLIGRFLLSILIPVGILVWTLYSYNKLDRFVNPHFFPELVGKGTVERLDSQI